jgi:transglutaminase-like putative cysteine protease
MRPVLLAALLATASVPAFAATENGEIIYAPPAAWVLPPPPPTDAPTPSDSPFRMIWSDQQVRLDDKGEAAYSGYRMRILKADALPVGNVSIGWNPSSGSATVHRLHIIRDGQVIDVLKDQKFRVIQREDGLEQAMLNGQLTATLQAEGLRVGDEIEFAATVTRRDPTLDDHVFGVATLPTQGLPGPYRVRLGWTAPVKLIWRASRDLPQAVPAEANGERSLTYELRDPGGVIVNDGAPARYNVRRLIEYSDFADWRDVSRRFAPLFVEAQALAADSPVRAEAAKIAAASSDPVARTEAALRLVQDEIRYVYVGLDGGNYRPAAADETWKRRYGDCKAKTALLLALLKLLKIEAEPVLVNISGDDGMDGRLASPDMFNHVLVRAKLGKASYWLDGTRSGDRYLDRLSPPNFRWGLALRTEGAVLEAVPTVAPKRPQFVGVVDIDASAGFGVAKVRASHVMHDDDAYNIQSRLAGMSREDADRNVGSYWRRQMDWVDVDKVAWTYDARQTTLVLSLEGTGKPGWEGDEKEGRRLDIAGAGFYAPDQRRRPKEQDQNAPWATNFPRYRCYATSIRLPVARAGWQWEYYADPVDRALGGTDYWRVSGLKDGVMRTIMSSRIDQPEISADEARRTNDAIPGFNNNISRVYEASKDDHPPAPGAPFGDKADWTGDALLCGPTEAP